MEPFEKNIKKHFDNKQYAYNESHWQEAQMLIANDQKRKRRWLIWWLSSVGGLALLIASYWFFAETKVITDKPLANIEIANADAAEQLPPSSKENTIENTNNVRRDVDGVTKPVTSYNQTYSRPDRVISNSFEKSSSSNDLNENIAQNIYETLRPNTYNSEIVIEHSQTGTNADAPESNELIIPSAEQKLITNSSIQVETSDISQVHKEFGPEVLDIRNEELIHIEAGDVQTPIVSVDNAENQVKANPIKSKSALKYGILSGYTLQSSIKNNEWLQGAYLGGRIGWTLSPAFSLGLDVALGFQQVNDVQFYESTTYGYGFGKDSIVLSKFAKNAFALQTPVFLQYSRGQHSFSAIMGARVLIHANARSEKIHYTNGDPGNSISAELTSRSSLIFSIEEAMPQNTITPFSLYAGLRYNWMLSKGWGLETSLSSTFYRNNTSLPQDFNIALDKGIRIELGVVKVF